MRSSLPAVVLLLAAPPAACALRRPAPEPVGAQSAFAPDGCVEAAISQRTADSSALAAPIAPPAGSYVLARFYIDRSGKPEMQTFEVIRASDQGLIPKARELVAKSRFRPFEPLPGCPVRGLVVQPLAFPAAEGRPE